MTGAVAGAATDLPAGIPRANGELVFAAPWESRAFGLAAAYVEAKGCGWDRFRRHLIAAIARLPDDTPYYEAWVAAIEDLLAEDGMGGAPASPGTRRYRATTPSVPTWTSRSERPGRRTQRS